MMRKIEYLSPSGLGCFENNPTEFYLRYLADERPPSIPQSKPMSIGSAFDAMIKSYLNEKLFGGNDPRFVLTTLFEAQVEPHNRDWALEHGKYVFECYKQSGALNDLLLDLMKGQNQRFEFDVKGAIHGYREGVSKNIESVVLLGKPDASYINTSGQLVVLDWKVSGYCSKTPPSPMPGYLKLRAHGGTNYGCHKTAQIMLVNGSMINVSSYLEDLNPSWATQLSIYSWLCGLPVGGEAIVAIDQLACDASKTDLPSVKVAEHRLRISPSYQKKVFARCLEAWEIATSDHFFRDMSKEESQARCAILDEQARALKGSGSDLDKWFSSVTRGV